MADLRAVIFESPKRGPKRLAHLLSREDIRRLVTFYNFVFREHATTGRGVVRFLDDWATVEERQTAAVLEASPLAAGIRRFVGARGAYEGTASELHTALEDAADDKDALRKNKAWPKTPQSLSRKLNEVVPTLELHGVKVVRENRGKGKTARRVIVLSDVTNGGSAAIASEVCRESAAIDPGLPQSNPADSGESGNRSVGSAASGVILAECNGVSLSRKRWDKDERRAVDGPLQTRNIAADPTDPAQRAATIDGRDIEREDYALSRTPSGGWALRGTLEETRMGDLRRQIVDFLVDEGEPRTSKAISQGIGQKHDTVRSKCSRMHRGGQLSRKGDKYWLPIKDVGGDSGDSDDSATQLVCIAPLESPPRLGDPYYLDFETHASEDGPATDPDLCAPRLAQLSTGGETVVYDLRDHLAAFSEALGDRAGTLVAHNASFELRNLERLGLDWRGDVFDTLVADKIICPHGEDVPTRWKGAKYNTRGRHTLDAVAARYLGEALDKSEQKSDWSAEVLTDEQIAYARRDVDVLVRLVPVLLAYLEDVPPDVWRQDMDLVKAVSTLPRITVDPDEYARLLDSHTAAFDATRNKCNNIGMYPVTKAEVDSRTPKKRAEHEMSVDSAKDVEAACGAKSTKDSDLRSCGERGNALADFKKAQSDLTKLVNTWGPRAERGWVRPGFNVGNTWTGRMSSSEPNIQQLDKNTGVRRLLTPDEGRAWVSADFSQVEPRVMASLSDDEAAAKALNAVDVYQTVADELGCSRQEAKAVFLGWGYGRGLSTLARDLDGDEARARRLVKRLEQTFPGAHARRLEASQDFGYGEQSDEFTVKRTAMGRPLHCFDYTTALNCEIQGTAAEMMKRAILLAIDRGLDVRLAVHDELVISAPADAIPEHVARLAGCMSEAAESVLPGHYPVEVETGPTFGDLSELEGVAA